VKKIWKLRRPFLDSNPAIPFLGITKTELEQRFGHPCDQENAWGLGPCLYWGFEAECGLQLVIVFYELKQLTYLYLDEPELDHALLHLSWQASQVEPAVRDSFESCFGKRPLHWQVCRQDDHGNRFVINAFATDREAACLLQSFERLHHKQTYWIEATETEVQVPK
jgi:hypothetical protein